jgi:replication-associated recombination protein RarA
MLLALGAAAMAQADVLSLLKQGMAARQRGDDDAAIYYLSAVIAAGKRSCHRLGQPWGRVR